MQGGGERMITGEWRGGDGEQSKIKENHLSLAVAARGKKTAFSVFF